MVLKMKNKGMETAIKTIEVTLGELIEAVTQIAAEHTDNDKEKYLLATQAVEEILNAH